MSDLSMCGRCGAIHDRDSCDWSGGDPCLRCGALAMPPPDGPPGRQYGEGPDRVGGCACHGPDEAKIGGDGGNTQFFRGSV